MEEWGSISCILTQPQQKLQLDYKTNITQNHQNIKLYGSLTTKELKKPHSSRWVGGAKRWNVQSHTHIWYVKIERDRDIPVPHQSTQPGIPAPGRLSSHNF